MSKNPRTKQKPVTTQCCHRSNPGVLSVNPAKEMYYFWIFQPQWPDQIAFTKPNKCYLMASTWEKSEAQPFSLLQNIKVGRRTFKYRTTDKPRVLPRRTVTSKRPLMNLWSLQQYIWTVCSICPSLWVRSTSWTFRSWVFFNYTPLLNNGNSTYQYNEQKN